MVLQLLQTEALEEAEGVVEASVEAVAMVEGKDEVGDKPSHKGMLKGNIQVMNLLKLLIHWIKTNRITSKVYYKEEMGLYGNRHLLQVDVDRLKTSLGTDLVSLMKLNVQQPQNCTVPLSVSGVSGILVSFIHSLPVRTQGQDGSCIPETKVRKNTVYTASREHQLNITCPVTYCKEIPVFKWYKIGAKNKYTDIIGSNQVKIAQEPAGLNGIISYLSFRKISTDDTGTYRCKISTSNFSSESHNIKVNVSDSSDHANTNNTSGISDTVSDVRWLLYVFICFGIPGLALIVMLISFMCINRCLRKANSRRHKNARFSPKPLSTTTKGKIQEFPKEENNIYHVPSDDLYTEALYIQNNQECTPDIWNGNRSHDEVQQIVYATHQQPTP
ncbi:uncharacterized protein LOC132892206 [Neoarius graeffei]|uniref:uncharacterized protein LOC132892206 n=1 Tax=Neoarius graeffei TaxID=443677 RepID=UPI00298C8179|nr:uncharacterized protein LOC132892206 [Neoarius graeffei]